MHFNVSDVMQGVADAEKRWQQDLNVPFTFSGETRDKLARVFNDWPVEHADHFVKLFSELVAVAAAARSNFNEPALDEDAVRGYLGHSVSFFNSFTHR